MPDDIEKPDPNASRLYCPACGYNVGPTSDFSSGAISTCPECGEKFEAEYLAKQAVPKKVSGGRVVWHLFWPAIIVFSASIVPVLSLLTMPIAAITLLIVNGFTSTSLAKRIVYHHIRNDRKLSTDKVTGIMLLLWFAQAALIAFAAFGGCSIALNNFSLH